MQPSIQQLGLYLHLAQASHQRRHLHARDRLLVVAASIAAQLLLPGVSAECRRRVLGHNAAHLVRQWPTIEHAMADDDFQHFLKQLLRRYPLEKAERMLDSLGIEMGQEREVYYTDEEYAMALLRGIKGEG